jgi:UDP-glucose 4-epimerase
MSRILITGCSGFIGSRLAIQAKQFGHDVVASAKSPSEILVREMGMPIMELNVLAPILWGNGKDTIDAIIHCATANDILSRNLEDGVNLSVYGTQNILDFAVRQGIKRIIVFSTLQVYGTELSGVVCEETPVCCQLPYGLNHFYAEELCRMYSRTHGLDVVLLRPSNIYGVPDVSTVRRDTLVPMCFVKEAIQTGAINLRSSGRQKRNFISTHEVANACLHLLNAFPQGCEVVNLGSNLLCEIREIAEITSQIYFIRYGKQLKMNILSNEPMAGNSFSIDSRIASLRPSAEESRQFMVSVITQLFENINQQKE